MPALTREFHKERLNLERLFEKDLDPCVSSHSLYDPHAVLEYARTYAIDFYDLYYNYYSQFPDYREHWQPASAAFALQRVLHCLRNFSAIETYLELDRSHVDRITRTISDRAKSIKKPEANHIALTGKQAAAFARAGIDMASASPLLLMLHEQANRTSDQLPQARPAIPASSESIGEQIRQLREECLLTNEQLAEALDVDRRSVVRHISGDNRPSKQHIAKYQEIFSARLGKEVRLKTSL
ncbi:MAG: helix-turn-helix transcriptional regulator [Terracidiphilus sp.]